jgi:metal-responsive CopG/Arc/MetJ family transcriptional regulator
MKTAISLPDPVFEAAEALAARLGMSRSELYATAVVEYVKAHDRGRITESLNRVYEEIDQSPDPVLETLQLATLRRDPW